MSGQFDFAYLLEYFFKPAFEAVYSWFFALLDSVPSMMTFVFTSIVFVFAIRFFLMPIFTGGAFGGLSDTVSKIAKMSNNKK